MYRLDQTGADLVAKLATLADERIAPYAAEVDAQGRFPVEAMQALAEGGFYGLSVPQEYDGLGQGMRVACAILDQLAQRCASTAMVYLMHLCGTACFVAHPQGNEEILRQIAAGKHLTTLAWSERGSRSHFWAPVSQATSENGHLVLNANKSWVTSAGYADSYVVSTRTAGGTEPTDTMLYSVLKTDSGISVSGPWNGLGMRGNASAPMVLEQCEISTERALSDLSKGFDAMMGVVLPWFALGNASVSVGNCEAAVTATVKHLNASKLEHLGQSLADLPTLRARLAEMRIETDRARAHLVSVLDAVESADPAAQLLVLEIKAAAGDSALKVTDLGMQACGGAAFSKHLTIERNFRDARAAVVMAPTADVLKEFIGRALLGMSLF
jgi:alkylation response protein AidB-like acyl-CoA dehydrogenase